VPAILAECLHTSIHIHIAHDGLVNFCWVRTHDPHACTTPKSTNLCRAVTCSTMLNITHAANAQRYHVEDCKTTTTTTRKQKLFYTHTHHHGHTLVSAQLSGGGHPGLLVEERECETLEAKHLGQRSIQLCVHPRSHPHTPCCQKRCHSGRFERVRWVNIACALRTLGGYR
jgi:hypothetical protein